MTVTRLSSVVMRTGYACITTAAKHFGEMFTMRRFVSAVLLLGLLSLGCNEGCTSRGPIGAATGKAPESGPVVPSVAVFATIADYGEVCRKPVLVVWVTGTVAVSADRVRGGGPYHLARVLPRDASRLASRLVMLSQNRLGRDQTDVGWTIPDSSFQTVFLHSEVGTVALEASLPFSEENPDVVETPFGLVAKSELASLPAAADVSQEKWFTEFHDLWRTLWGELLAALPVDGHDTVPTLAMEVLPVTSGPVSIEVHVTEPVGSHLRK